MISIEGVTNIIAGLNDHSFSCPGCGAVYDGSECETAQYVVSFWGEEDHDFSCNTCGQDFVVREVVMRSFSAAKTSSDLDEE